MQCELWRPSLTCSWNLVEAVKSVYHNGVPGGPVAWRPINRAARGPVRLSPKYRTSCRLILPASRSVRWNTPRGFPTLFTNCHTCRSGRHRRTPCNSLCERTRHVLYADFPDLESQALKQWHHRGPLLTPEGSPIQWLGFMELISMSRAEPRL